LLRQLLRGKLLGQRREAQEAALPIWITFRGADRPDIVRRHWHTHVDRGTIH
jgi:hypothetical protein